MIYDMSDMDMDDETNSRGGLVTMSFWKGKTAAMLCAAAVFVTIFMTGTADVFAAVDDHTVQGKLRRAQSFLYLTTGSMSRARRIMAAPTIMLTEG